MVLGMVWYGLHDGWRLQGDAEAWRRVIGQSAEVRARSRIEPKKQH